ncbi:hypothetical protein A2971_01440 [Candidatus Gottesmanbacteria bacterium RIFCSPLOWO2_01_FULL_46_21]|uniref:Sulfatase n=2 Tax=Microgenomates group TaxID=1794810 RepID=A0A0G0WK94_9BACT|nr:MAG: Sulfatase [Candidatus Daviesbacteria bacterium GW2011_GWB1_41_5]OGG29793.1 MAG: hypothetical protein A2971_01440 [Candidatus Gottesmanbacteria bacterium RIFCSPLOWO2_01_FULL_46_21]
MTPNILLITIDSLRADYVGYQNPKENNTPFLDELAKKSIIFTNAIVPSLPTFFCFPSIMTGTLPFTNGTYLGISESKGVKTIAQVLKNHGYDTTAYIADNPTLYMTFGYDKGFDHYFDGYEESNKSFLLLQESLWNLRRKMPNAFLNLFDVAKALRHLIVPWRMSIDGITLNRKIIEYINQNGKQPFFLWAHYMDAHLPYVSGIDKYFYREKSIIKKLLKRIVFYKEISSSTRKMKIKDNHTLEIIKEAYRSSIKYTDQVLKELYMIIKKRFPNTIFIITSDHGEAFMEHGLFHHEPYSLYEELIKVPLIINLPSNTNRSIAKVVSLLSIAKTICSLVSIRNTNFQGSDLLTSHEADIDHITRILYKCRSPHVRLGILDNKSEIKEFRQLWSYRASRYKYIMESEGEKEELFDLQTDPLELKNIAQRNKKEKKNAKKILEKYM